MKYFFLFCYFMISICLIVGCKDGDDNGSGDGDTDSDGDADSDTDADSDGDACPGVDVSKECPDTVGVFDSANCLCWEKSGTSDAFTWDGAVSYCDNLDAGGFTDWQLASKQDYMDMLGDCDDRVMIGAKGNCAQCADVSVCKDVFNATTEAFWTSTSDESEIAWYIDISAGFLRPAGTSNEASAQCLRSVK
ncbi:MAG: DUF1566 domain-containing protein [Deltaproteobacteria bacterium]|nr:DUF1566 domain-containing protein [Deltaproteobacteria bacterium]